MKIILASSSPRRKEILSRLNINFIVDFGDFEEPPYSKDSSPDDYCKKLSKIKVESIFKKYSDRDLIIGADTIVVIGDDVLGKPSDKKDAFNMLMKLSGKNHTVITAITIKYKGLYHTFSESTTVQFYNLSDLDVLKYINTQSPYDKAGSYGIQDYSTIFVKQIKGSYDNVVGFPLSRFYNELKKINISI
tara:strand:- start:398 stop:967 length:570 start_codon:yes stop_codon:yes gene_type:complete